MNHNEEIIIQGIAERLREAYRMSQLLHDHTRDQLAAYFERQQVSPIWEIKYMAITLENALQEIVSS